jgi:hypothetical protein
LKGAAKFCPNDSQEKKSLLIAPPETPSALKAGD